MVENMGDLAQSSCFSESSNKAGPVAQKAKSVQYTRKEERDASELQITWNNVMDQGNYRRKSLYTHVAVLVLYWEKGDLNVHDEIKGLVDIFENQFNYSVEHGPLKGPYANTHINKLVASFVHTHNGPGTLMIVYYAGHGRPGEFHGSLELFGSAKHSFGHRDERLLIYFRKTATSPSKDEVNKLIWNNTENFLKDACADVLQIFDWYDGLSCESAINELINIMLVVMPETSCLSGAPAGKQDDFRPFYFSLLFFHSRFVDLFIADLEHRAFEYLAATKAGERTNAPGKSSFTSALCYALKKLLKGKKRFTTGDLGREIRNYQHFPPDQEPVLTDRDDNSEIGRIELHALLEQDGIGSAGAEDSQLSAYDGRVLTLHFDFGSQPSKQDIHNLGERFNRGRLEQFGLERIRWGGVKETGFRQSVNVFRKLHRRRILTPDELHGIAMTPTSTASPFSREETARCEEPAVEPRSTESSDTCNPRLTAKRRLKESTGREKKRRKG
jgi:hypothetical protein